MDLNRSFRYLDGGNALVQNWMVEPCRHGRWVWSGHSDGGRGDHDGRCGAARKISEVQKKLDNGEDGCHEEEGQVDVICGVVWSDGEGGDDIHDRVPFLPKPALVSSCLQPPWFDFKARKLLLRKFLDRDSLQRDARDAGTVSRRIWFPDGYGISAESLWPLGYADRNCEANLLRRAKLERNLFIRQASSLRLKLRKRKSSQIKDSQHKVQEIKNNLIFRWLWCWREKGADKSRGNNSFRFFEVVSLKSGFLPNNRGMYCWCEHTGLL